MDSPGVAPGLPACGAGVFLFDHEPKSGSRGTRTHSGNAAACFQNKFLIQPDDFRSLNCGSWNRTNIGTFRASYLAVRRSRIVCLLWHAGFTGSGGWNRNNDLLIQSQVSPTSSDDPGECPAGVEPASPGWKPGTSAARPRAHTRRKERESNPQGCEARPGSSGVPSPIGLSFRVRR